MVQTVILPKDIHEYVKCVVVGDSSVGKTCLTCAWSVGTKYKLENLVKSHVPTVFAVDHYTKDRNVKNRSWCNIDGVPVSLHIWDTFGYHDKDRGFAYKGADVVLLCFSVARPSSIDSVLKFWVPEIRAKCKSTPIVLVGTQADMRYVCLEENYINMNKGMVYKEVKPKDIILPDKGRAVARQIGAPYYETSVLTQYGIDDVFFNVIRAAMIERRKIKFWSTQLRRIRYPLIQKPIEWPTRPLPAVIVPNSTVNDEIAEILMRQNGDMIVNVHGVCFRTHRIILASSCQIMEDILTKDYSCLDNTEESNASHFGQNGYCHEIHMAGFEKIEYRKCEDPFNRLHGEMVTVLSLSNEISPLVWQFILEYLYSGKVKEVNNVMSEAKKAADLLQLSDLSMQISYLQSNEGFLNLQYEKEFSQQRIERLKRLAIVKGVFTDVQFSLDDGIVAAHKPLLMARCDMMAAMFTDNFIEATAPMIALPGVTVDVFKALQEYLYTGSVTNVTEVDCLSSLIEVANRFCLPRLVNVIELAIVQQFMELDKQRIKILDDVISLIELAQLHNAHQLAKWCLEYVCQNYIEAKQYCNHSMLVLSQENTCYLEKYRCPPAWYVYECQQYNQSKNEDNDMHSSQRRKQFQRMQLCRRACLCFKPWGHFQDTDMEEVPG